MAEGNEPENRQIPFELAYPLCFVEYNCTTNQGEYLYNEFADGSSRKYEIIVHPSFLFQVRDVF